MHVSSSAPTKTVDRAITPRHRGLYLGLSTLTYILSFLFFHEHLHINTHILAALPIVVAGWGWGFWSGGGAGLLSFPLNTALTCFVSGISLNAALARNQTTEYGFLLLLGLLIGARRDVLVFLTQQASQQESMTTAQPQDWVPAHTSPVSPQHAAVQQESLSPAFYTQDTETLLVQESQHTNETVETKVDVLPAGLATNEKVEVKIDALSTESRTNEKSETPLSDTLDSVKQYPTQVLLSNFLDSLMESQQVSTKKAPETLNDGLVLVTSGLQEQHVATQTTFDEIQVQQLRAFFHQQEQPQRLPYHERNSQSGITPLLREQAHFTPNTFTAPAYASHTSCSSGLLHDPLTGLPNRVLFLDRLSRELLRSKRRDNEVFAVLSLDLDRFRVLRDSLGATSSNQILVDISQRLCSCLRDGDTVARFNHDEFVMLLVGISDISDAVRVADRMLETLYVPFHIDDQEFFTSASIGIALSTTGYKHAETLIQDATTAMNRAKTLGRARYEVFDPEMRGVVLERLQLENDLRRALSQNELRVHYQPIVDLHAHKLMGFEALVRWDHPEHGLLSPLKFIKIAEETGLIVDIDRWVMSKACEQLRIWEDQYEALCEDNPIFVSINLSSQELLQTDLLEFITATLQEWGIKPKNLKLELTESILVEDLDYTTTLMRRLRTLGLQLSIDDFGTGYSSLNYLHRFPLSTLKIDRSFVQLLHKSDSEAIVRMIVSLGHQLGMEVIAEGVEEDKQREILQQLGCEYAQGYFFSRPIPASEATDFITQYIGNKTGEA